MDLENKKELLQAVNDAITNILSGGAVQDYEIAGRKLRRYSLRELMDLRHQLNREIAAEQGSNRNHARIGGDS